MWVRCETFKQLSYVVYQLTLVVCLRRGIFEMILHPAPRFPSQGGKENNLLYVQII